MLRTPQFIAPENAAHVALFDITKAELTQMLLLAHMADKKLSNLAQEAD